MKSNIRQTAKQKFQLDDRVKMTVLGIKNAPHSHNSIKTYTGKVVGFSKVSSCVRILRDKLKTDECWHMDYWEKDE